MEIVIVGAGRVGYRLAKSLSTRHDVTMIDRNREALERIAETADIFTLVGDAEDPGTYRSLLDESVDLFIAVADSDEVNIISCLIADDAIRAKQKIIRLKNNFFAKSSIAEKLGITEAVFPVRRIAQALESLLRYPKANSVKSINVSPYKLMSIRIYRESSETVPPVSALESEQVKVVGIERNKRFFIITEETAPEPGDLLYLFGDPEAVRAICGGLDTRMPSTIKNIVIFGADALGIEIAATLSSPDIKIKIVDHDIAACEAAAAQLLDKATVINGRYGDHRLFEEEGLKNADMLIAATKTDAENIIKCVEAREFGIERVAAINNEAEYYQLMHNLGIVAVRGPKIAAYYAILEKINSSSVVIGKHFCGSSGVVLARTINPDSPLIGKTEILPFDHPDCRCMLQRSETLIPFRGALTGIQDGDVILAFCLAEISEKVKKWIHAL